MSDRAKGVPPVTRPPSDSEVEGLFRLVGQGADPNEPVSDEEADFILRVAEQIPLSDQEIDETTRWLLEQLSKTGDQNATTAATEMSPVVAARSAAALRAKVSIYQSCRELKVEAAGVASRLRLNEEILLQLDQGRARSVPQVLLSALAAALRTSIEQIRCCFEPDVRGPARMAAHGRRGAGRSRSEVVDFLVIVQRSSLPDEDKQYWWGVVNAEAGDR